MTRFGLSIVFTLFLGYTILFQLQSEENLAESSPNFITQSEPGSSKSSGSEAASSDDSYSQQSRQQQQFMDEAEASIQKMPSPLSIQQGYKEDIAELFFDGKIGDEVTLEIYDSSGARILKRKHEVRADNYLEFVNLKFVENGVYMIKATSGGKSWYKKLIKQTINT